MLQARKGTTDLTQIVQVDGMLTEADVIGALGDDGSPGVDDEGFSVRSSCAVGSELGRGNDINLVFDGTRSQQNMPMVFSGREGEGGGDDDELGSHAHQTAIQFRKTQVIADGKAYPDSIDIHALGGGSGKACLAFHQASAIG